MNEIKFVVNKVFTLDFVSKEISIKHKVFTYQNEVIYPIKLIYETTKSELLILMNELGIEQNIYNDILSCSDDAIFVTKMLVMPDSAIVKIMTSEDNGVMNEILAMGDCSKDFERLGINPRLDYGNADTEYSVYSLNDKDFKILMEEPDEPNIWEDCGWRYTTGSNMGPSSGVIIVNDIELVGWVNELKDDETDEIPNMYIPQYRDLLSYMCEELGVSQPRNVCALAKDLAKFNNITMAKLFEVYQG